MIGIYSAGKFAAKAGCFGMIGYGAGWTVGRYLFHANSSAFGLNFAITIIAKGTLGTAINSTNWKQSTKLYLQGICYTLADSVSIIALASLGLIGTPGILFFGIYELACIGFAVSAIKHSKEQECSLA